LRVENEVFFPIFRDRGSIFRLWESKMRFFFRFFGVGGHFFGVRGLFWTLFLTPLVFEPSLFWPPFLGVWKTKDLFRQAGGTERFFGTALVGKTKTKKTRKTNHTYSVRAVADQYESWQQSLVFDNQYGRPPLLFLVRL